MKSDRRRRMKLYEINEEILRLTEQITVDEETGEVESQRALLYGGS